MARKKPLIIVTRKLPEAVETRMRELFDARLNLTDTPMTPSALKDAVETADILVPTITDRIDAKIVNAAGTNLKLIANYGAGIDHIDVKAAMAKGIVVTNTPNVLTEDTADLTMALILAVPRRLVEGAAVLERGGFTGWSPTWMMGRRVGGLRLGIVGMGRIGQAVAKRARRSASKSIITIASPFIPPSSANWRRPIGKASTRCWRAWTSSRSIARTRPRPIICSPRAG